MTQNNEREAFEKWLTKIDQEYDEVFEAGELAQFAYQAATQSSEIEINALKERVAELESELFVLQELRKNQATLGLELTASNNQLRDALEIARDYQFYANQQFHIDFEGYKEDEHAQYDADLANTDKALSSTPAQSLAEHDNDVIERIALALENAEGELKTLPEYVALVRVMKND